MAGKLCVSITNAKNDADRATGDPRRHGLEFDEPAHAVSFDTVPKRRCYALRLDAGGRAANQQRRMRVRETANG